MTLRLTLTAHVHRLPLAEPYHLSFGTVRAFDTVYVLLEGEGRTGLGEITPLPGYGHETVDGVCHTLAGLARDLEAGASWDEAVACLVGPWPFTASGLACAMETWRRGMEASYGRDLPPVPLSAFCGGTAPEAAATRAWELAEAGYDCLKLKVGAASVAGDAARLRAVCAALPPGVVARLDANQAYAAEGRGMDEALALCRELEGLDNVELLEQPFGPDDWDAHADLAGRTTVPLMLDESVWTEAHVRRAADCGARLVKCKLCKHPGMGESLRLLTLARDLGLGAVYGNGVQSAVGNYLEARVHHEAGLVTASEGNGFLKPAADVFGGALRAEDGMLLARGLDGAARFAASGEVVARAVLTLDNRQQEQG